jgi:integrase
MVAIPEEEMKRILDRAAALIPRSKERQWLVIKTLSKTGVRVSELIHIRPNDLDKVENTIFIPQGKSKPRHVEVDPMLIRELLVFSDNRKIRVNAPIFPLSRQRIGQITKKHCGINPHAFRHSYAKALQDKGASVNFIRRQLGHYKLETTQIYLEGMSTQEERQALRELFV